ncbi:MAG: RagB/SusD family nutrient uptake outer membrane protein [Gemmatimonadota bacterium]
MTTQLGIRARGGIALFFLAALGACGTFDVTNPNQPTLDDLVSNPTKAKLAVAATGIFATSRSDIQAFIWRVGSMGREGINLSGNNQPDYQEPYFGPLASGGSFGATLWAVDFAHIRSVNIYLDAVPVAPDLSAAERSASLGFAKTLKALAFMYVIETRAQNGAPVDVGRAVTGDPPPFVSQDSVYGYILGLLNEAQTNLQAGSGAFPFPVPPGYAGFDTPATFVQFNRALAAKAYVLRGTVGCGAPCFTSALAALTGSFLVADPGQLKLGVYFDFSTAAGDQTNGLSDPLGSPAFFAVPRLLTQAQTQADGTTLDQRALDKVAAATLDPPQQVGGVNIPGTYKFTNFFTGGDADPSAPIPIIRNEELILLRAEANLGLGNNATALADINFIRTSSGHLAPTTLTAGSPKAALVDELLYNRLFSLLWEQGTRWIDARRYNLLGTINVEVDNGHVPTVMPVPADECSARNLPAGCSPLTGG